MKQDSIHIVYVANTRLPTEKAHGLATVKICEAFALVGAEITLIIPLLWRKAKNIFSEYGIKKRFKITKIPTVDMLSLGMWHRLDRTLFLFQMISFSIVSAFYCRVFYGSKNIVYFSHDYIPLFFLSILGLPIYYDIHHFPGRNFMYKRVMKKSLGFSVQTMWKKDKILKDYGFDNDKIVYWPNGTDIDIFSTPMDRRIARRKINISENDKTVVYTGALIGWKGVDTLINSINAISGLVAIYIVGGSHEDILFFKEKYPVSLNSSINFIPHVSREEIVLWMKAADILVLPNTGLQKVSLYYTSPMKLFEYMASGTPIVASDIPSIREIVDEECVYFAEPDNPASFGKIITEVLENPDEALEKGKNSQNRVLKYSWTERSKVIIGHLNRLLN